MEQFEMRIDEDIVLKLLEEEDASEVFGLIDENRSYLREWLPWLDFTQNVNDSKDFILLNQKKFLGGSDLGTGIFYKGSYAGMLGINQKDPQNKYTSEVGYWLGEKFNGNGIITKSCKALVTYGFDKMNFNRIQIRAAINNKKSRAVPERLGFKQEGVLQEAEFLYDRFLDLVIYGMVKKNWNFQQEI